MKDLSIIVPHYNTPDLLEKLLSTIVFDENIEVLVIDDKSDKNLDEYHKLKIKWENRVIFLDNATDKKGAGICRNIGLEKAVGKWLFFADSDDYFAEGYNDILNRYLNSDYDMVYFMPDSVSLETGKPAHRHEAYKRLLEKYLTNKNDKNLYELIFTYITPWGKLIRRDIVLNNGIVFDDTIVANDVMFMTQSAYYSRNNVYVDSEVVYYVTRMAKTLTTKKDERKFDVRLNVFLRRYNFLHERLDNKQFKYINLNRIAISQIINAIMYGYGIKKAISVLNIFVKNKVYLFDIGLLNPIDLFQQIKMYLSWRFEDKRLQ